jgi:trk system potassium uptake protein
VVAIKKKNGIIIAFKANDVIEEKDVMVIIGSNEHIKEFENKLAKQTIVRV